MDSKNAPNASSPLIWLFGVMAIGSATLFGIARQSDNSQPADSKADSAKNEAESKKPTDHIDTENLEILADYLRVMAVAPEETSTLKIEIAEPPQKLSLSASLKTNPSYFDLSASLCLEPALYEFMIATVPDPVDSKFPNEFDAVIDGIQRAFEARGFVLRTSRMLWPHQRSKAAEDIVAHTAPPYRDHPGIMLFGKINPTDEKSTDGQQSDSISGSLCKPLYTFALVCLVGESPISGIHKPSFTAALKAREVLDKAIKKAQQENNNCREICWQKPNGPIHIVAPYFSGSQSSLLLALRQWKLEKGQDHPSLRIISGSASALDLKMFEYDDIYRFESDPVGDTDHKVHWGELSSTVIPNELVTKGVLSYLTDNRTMNSGDVKRKISQRVAILREANTRFGVDNIGDTAKNHFYCQYNSYLSGQDEQIIDLPFPMAIHRLQVEQEKRGKSAVMLPQTGFVEPKQSHLNRIDAIPPYDPASTTSSAGQSLRTILTVINRADVRYVGIVATDQRDVVFLNRMLRNECPQVRVFTTEPSIALIHPDEAYHLRGMLVGSTYPFHPITQPWGRPNSAPNRMISFPSQGSQGYFNATLAQFGDDRFMLGYLPPSLNLRANEEKSCATIDVRNRPPIWISVVGHSGQLIPVHCYTDYEGKDPKTVPVYSARVSPNTTNKPIVGAPVGLVFASLAAVILFLLVIISLWSKTKWRDWAAGLTDEEHAEIGERDASNNKEKYNRTPLDNASFWIWFWRGIMLAGILLFVLPYTLPVLETWEPCCTGNIRRHHLIFAFAVVITCEFFVILVLLGLLSSGILKPHAGEHRLGYFAMKALVLTAGIWTLISYWWHFSAAPVERFFLYVRMTEMAAGISVAIPMGLLGAALFAMGWFCLQQASLSRLSRLTCPYPNAWKKLIDADVELNAHLANHVYFLSTRRYLSIAICLGLFGLLYLVRNLLISPLPSGEIPSWDILMDLVFSGTAVALVFLVVRFLTIWSQLRKLLKAIMLVPMVSAFERLPNEITQLHGGYLNSERKTYNSHLWALAWTLPRQERDKLVEWISHTKKSGPSWIFSEIKTTPSDEEDEVKVHDVPDRKHFQKRLQDCANSYLLDLSQEWRTHSIEEAFGIAQPLTREEKLALETKSNHDNQPTPEELSVVEKENYVASFIVLYLTGYFAQLRMLARAMVTAAPLILCAAASYTFQPSQPLLTVFVVLLAAVAFATAYVLYRINVNRVVSRIMGTTPNKFTPDWSFFTSIATYVVPVVTLVLVHVLGLFRFIAEPILELFQ